MQRILHPACCALLLACTEASPETVATPDATTPSDTLHDPGTEPDPTDPGETETETTDTGGGDTGTVPTEPKVRSIATTENLEVAFLGDQGLGLGAMSVMELLVDEDVDLIVWLGDFDYTNLAFLWKAQMDLALGEDIPWLAVVGNHDVDAWDDYEAIIEEKLATMPEAECIGQTGVQQSCTFEGLQILLSGVGTMGENHEAWLQDELDADDHIWRICAWHKNQADMQTGDKGDEVGWGAFQVCQDNAALITMGHEHAYSRTLTLTEVGNAKTGHGATGKPDVAPIGYGRTTAIVSGLAGKEIRDFNAKDHDDDTWWASYYTEDRWLDQGEIITDFEAYHGTLIVTFHVDGDPRKARGRFINTNREVIDEFVLVAE